MPRRGESQPGSICSFVKPSMVADAQRELAVRLVEDGPLEVGRLHVGLPIRPSRAAERVLEVGGLAGEAAAVLRVVLVLAPPEVRRVGHVGVGVEDLATTLILADDERRRAGRRGVLERVAGGALASVRADAEAVLHLARLDEP